jgi:hypothetical protein
LVNIIGSASLAPVAERPDRAPASKKQHRSMTDHQTPPAGGVTLPLCAKCERPMSYVTTIVRVTEPGKVALFQCEHCEKVDIRSLDGG